MPERGFLIKLKRDLKVPSKFQEETGKAILVPGNYITQSNNFKNFIAGVPTAIFKFINNIPDYLDDLEDNDSKPTLLESAKHFFENIGEMIEDVVEKIKGESEETAEEVKEIVEEAAKGIIEEVVGDVEEVVEDIIEEVKEFITEKDFQSEIVNIIAKFDKGFEDLRKHFHNEIKTIQTTVDNINGGINDITAKVEDLNKQLITEKGRTTKISNKLEEICREADEAEIQEVVAEAIPPEAPVEDIELVVDKELVEEVEALTKLPEEPQT